MSTLRDYILDCRCPVCGTMMQQRQPPRRSRFWWLSPLVVLVDLVVSIVFITAGAWDKAAYFIGLAVFMVVTDR